MLQDLKNSFSEYFCEDYEFSSLISQLYTNVYLQFLFLHGFIHLVWNLSNI